MTRSYRIAILPGDGIGQEVTPQAVRALGTRRMGELSPRPSSPAERVYHTRHARA
jgi:hypothetical protein